MCQPIGQCPEVQTHASILISTFRQSCKVYDAQVAWRQQYSLRIIPILKPSRFLIFSCWHGFHDLSLTDDMVS